MPDRNPSKAVPIARRSVLATLGTAVATGLAGCGGGDGDDGETGSGDDTGADGDTGGNDGSSGTDTGGSDGTQSGDSDDTGSDSDDGTQSGDDGETQSGESNCPPVPSSYTREDIPAMLADGTLATIGVPESGPSINSGSAVLRVEYSRGSINVQSQNNSDTTVEDTLLPDLTEVTEDYDLPSGARAQRQEVAGSDRVDVYIPADPDVIYVGVGAAGPDECLEGSLTTIRDEMVNSIQLP